MFFYWKMLWRAFLVFGARFYSHYTQNIFSQGEPYVDGSHHLIKIGYVGIKENFSEHIWPLILKYIRVFFVPSVLIFWILTIVSVNDWSSINYHYSGSRSHKEFIQIYLCQKLSFLNHNMTRDCSLNAKKNTSSQHAVYKNCFLFLFRHSNQYLYTRCCQL